MLGKRLLSSAVIVPLLTAGMLFLPSGALLALLIVVSVVAMFEFYKVLDHASIPGFRFVGATCGTLIILTTYMGFRWHAGEDPNASVVRAAEWRSFAIMCTVFILMVRQFPQKNNAQPLPTIACTLLGVLYLPFLLSFFVQLGLFADNIDWHTPLFGRAGFYLAFYVLLVAKMTDTGAFFTGMLIGRHKLFPRLSPAKTWEGFSGGIVTGMVTSVVYFHFTGDRLGAVRVNLFHSLVLGALLSVAGTIGDLAESLLKRAAMAKDSGTIVPGMGGMLDLLDSVLFVTPLFYFYIRVVL